MIRMLCVLILLSSVGCTCADKMAFRKFHRTVTLRLYNWVLADNEMSKYKDREAEARAYLGELRAIDSPFTIASKLRHDGFHWHKESVDFVSWAWVTIARKRGDCDDFMNLWEAIFKRKGKTEKVSVTSKEGGGHAMLLFTPQGTSTLYILSNSRVLGTDGNGDFERLIRLFYRDKTDCFLRY